jgi:ABC-2 type transport system ATP-binding protein
MSDNAIELRGVGKRFTKYEDTPLLVTTALRLHRRTRRAKMWAIRDVDLDVPRGSTYGIIGRNGSGKTTLLSMIAGVTAPSEGSARVWGRIAPLIAVGVGFHRELTGRENVYLNGAILGLSERQIDQRLDAIVDFAEISGFLDTPVKFYSSGMYVRLGFAVAIHSEPEVLLVDEVLAVGDLGFQMKCYERMQRLQDSGTTIVVISHNLAVLQHICSQILLVDKGRPVFFGDPIRAIAQFHDILERDPFGEIRHQLSLPDGVDELSRARVSAELLGSDGQRVAHIETGTAVTVRAVLETAEALDDVIVGLTLTGPDGQTVYSDSTANRTMGAIGAGQSVLFTMSFVANLPTGTYSLTVTTQRDLSTFLARSKPIPFFVAGRVTVSGAADLRGVIERNDTYTLGTTVPTDAPIAAAEATAVDPAVGPHLL